MKSIKNKTLKKALVNKQLTIGSWLSLPTPMVAEIMSQAGFPWLVIDLEHSVIDLETMQSMFLAIENHRSIPLVRLSGHDPAQAKRALDAGAYGVIVPMVNTSEEAEYMVRSVKYPPFGTRGVGLARAQGYGMEFDDYISAYNENGVVICQIEHKEAVDNIDRILSVEGVDGIIVGPYDLSGSMGVPGELSHPLVLEAEAKILESASRHNISAGIHVVQPEPKQLQEKIDNGFSLIVYGVDQIFLGHSCGKAWSVAQSFLESCR